MINIGQKYWTWYIMYGCRRADSNETYVYWTVHHLDSWIKRDQLDVTCFIISLFNAQHVSAVSTAILRSLRLICWVISWVVLLWFDVCWCYVVVWLRWCGIRMQASACIRTPHQPTSETCWALNNEIIKLVTSSWSLFIQLSNENLASSTTANTSFPFRMLWQSDRRFSSWY